MSNNQPAQPEAVAVQIRPEGKKQLIDITFENVFMSIDIKKEKSKEVEERIILNKVSGICKAYELTAILGASGAGKVIIYN
jgi:ABC-type multidrug transport system fused ATPase/permease subunit